MSKGVGKVLNSKAGKVGAKVGKKIIKTVNKNLVEPSRNHKKLLNQQDSQWRKDNEKLRKGIL